MWDLIVSVPDQGLYFYFGVLINNVFEQEKCSDEQRI